MSNDLILEEIIADSITKTLIRALETQAIRHNNGLIRTNDLQRGVGKTTALVKFAKTHNLTVVLAHSHSVERLRKEFGYNKIISQHSQSIRGLRDFVIDEFVQIDKFGIRPITGFIKG